jgi:hypothetical protein
MYNNPIVTNNKHDLTYDLANCYHTIEPFNMRFSLLIAVSALLSAACVNAVDERLDYKLAKGQTADQFCNTWNSACNSYVPRAS